MVVVASPTDDDVSLDATIGATDPPNRPSGLEATVAPYSVTGGTLPAASGARAAIAVAANHDAELTIVDPAHYKMLGEFARGGLGRIVRARDLRTGRLVAIKEMLGSSSEIAKRFCLRAVVESNPPRDREPARRHRVLAIEEYTVGSRR